MCNVVFPIFLGQTPDTLSFIVMGIIKGCKGNGWPEEWQKNKAFLKEKSTRQLRWIMTYYF